MSALPDHASRLTALTAIDRSILVEAGAGSGKTALMAGRVVVLFANRIEPKNVAAITFTEFAAGELMMRINRFAAGLARGEVPREISIAFPDGISAEQQTNVEHAYKVLDQLTCTTIHGFAQALIKPYPAEAHIDPGAEIIDPIEADLAFQELYEDWLKARLCDEMNDSIVAALVLADQAGGLSLIEEVAQFLRHNRSSKPASARWSIDLLNSFVTAAKQFANHSKRHGFGEAQTDAASQAFGDLVESISKISIAKEPPSNQALVQILTLPRHEACFRGDGFRRKLQTKGKWQEAAKIAGGSKADGDRAYDGANTCYESCHDTLDALISAVAAELLDRLTNEMQDLIKAWHDFKQAAALLDFDDLLYTARDLLVGHEEVRKALAGRYQHVLVDEFQDTDPLQIDILWQLCSNVPKDFTEKPLTRTLRPGALFLVGDPKQAIYRFRGADVNAYVAARKAIGNEALLEVTTNFRSVRPILDFVNARFKGVLSEAAGQPGFSALSATHDAVDGAPSVAALDVPFDGDRPTASALRDAEADRVADLCNRLVGNVAVRDDHAPEKKRPCRFGDIALLAPAGTDLWRFEQALEDRSIPVSTQAGKGFFRRQEIHDLIALTRALADGRDTLALGALMRGPLVGLTEGELLDIVEALPPDPARADHLPCLDLRTDAAYVTHEVARSVLEILQSLNRRSRGTTPHMLLADAVAALNVRPQLRQRFKAGTERAIANVDLFLEMSRAYDVRGLRAFARDMRANWEEATRQVEGRPDAEQEAISLITVHAAKGLEWPIVIPINMTGTPQSESALVQDRRSSTFSVPVLGVEPTAYTNLRSWSEQELARERVRLWYVATTRARDLLILPRHSAKLPDNCWARIVDFGLASLAGIESEIGEGRRIAAEVKENAQTREIFATEAARIAKLSRTLVWQRPSRDEADGASALPPLPLFENSEDAEEPIEISAPAVAGSSTRGSVLHKLIEELLTGELQDGVPQIERRTLELLGQLGIKPVDDPKTGISPTEIARTVTRTLTLPDIAALRSRLLPEQTVFGRRATAEGEVLVSGIADAIAPDGQGRIDAVIDWKSDVHPSKEAIAHYRKQIEDYRRHTGAKRALLVLMTLGRIIEVT
jgi:ATP-dependent exoDNAse (exonuclease V) beta subunit